MVKVNLKYADVVKPQAKAIAENIRQDLEHKTGKKYKIKNLVTYSDEMRMEFKEIP